jgi:hypothetical protein
MAHTTSSIPTPRIGHHRRQNGTAGFQPRCGNDANAVATHGGHERLNPSPGRLFVASLFHQRIAHLELRWVEWAVLPVRIDQQIGVNRGHAPCPR